MVELALGWDRALTINLFVIVEYCYPSLVVRKELLLWKSIK